MENSSVTQQIKNFLITFTFFAFPLFFLPTTQEYFTTNKLYLLIAVALILIVISTIEFMMNQKIIWHKSVFDSSLILWLFAVALSTLFVSPNRLQALLNPYTGLLATASLVVIFFYANRTNVEKTIVLPLSISATIVSLLSLMFIFQPFKNASLPFNLSFLKNQMFTPIGTQLDLTIFLTFSVVFLIGLLYRNSGKRKATVLYGSLLVPNAIALLVTAFFLLKPVFTTGNIAYALNLPPMRLSWYAALEVLKNPLTAIFGAGIDDFPSMFTRVKDLAYNQSPQWQIFSFSASHSTFLHIFTEAGILGLVSFLLILTMSARQILTRKGALYAETHVILPFLLMIVVMLFLPPSLVVFFLFFTVVILIHSVHHRDSHNPTEVNFHNIIPLYAGVVALSAIVLLASLYVISRAYLAEVYFKQSVNGLAANDLKVLYENQRAAINTNPYIESYHISFSQTNALIANNIAAKAKGTAKLSDQDKQTVSQAIQAAIDQAKIAASLNSQKSVNWENLANIYRTILTVVQGADAWTVAAFQRAIVLDPQNPAYRLSLGGVYYSLGDYESASRLFEQATALKPDWSNAHYNLAWTYYQNKKYQAAVTEMQTVISLLDPKKDQADLQKAQQDLDQFKKSLAPSQEQTPPKQAPQQLSLPTPATTLSPKIKLPAAAAPTIIPTTSPSVSPTP